MNTEIAQDDPKFLPTKMGVTDYKIRKLREEYDPANLPAQVVKGDDAYQQVHNKVMAITKIRTGVEKVRKELKADALEWGRKVDGEAKRLTALVEEIEAPWKQVKQEADEAQAKAEEEERQAEQRRVAAIEEKVVGLQHAAEGLLNANAASILKRLEKVRGIVITEDDYEEYYDAAVHHHQIAIEALTSAHAAKVAAEAQAAELAEMKAKVDAQQAELDRQEAARQEAERQAEQDEIYRQEAARQIEHTAAYISEQPIEDYEEARPVVLKNQSDFEFWWTTYGRYIKPTGSDSYSMESFRERLAQASWEAKG